jgi:pyridoxine kinase
LQRLGHEVIALPTILLSNHPGHAKVTGERVSVSLLQRMLDALDANGWLGEIDAVITGYLPSLEHVRFACATLQHVRRQRGDARVLVDPIVGDEPKGLYIDAAAATGIRDELVPLAHIVTPNAFELEWLTGARIAEAGQIQDAVKVLGADWALVTSLPAPTDHLDNVLIQKREPGGWACAVPRQDGVPNGTGDFLAALLLGHELKLGVSRTPEAFGLALAGAQAAIAASCDHDELQLAASQAAWAEPIALSLRRL